MQLLLQVCRMRCQIQEQAVLLDASPGGCGMFWIGIHCLIKATQEATSMEHNKDRRPYRAKGLLPII